MEGLSEGGVQRKEGSRVDDGARRPASLFEHLGTSAW